ncbi:MAG TPA: phosphotransferase [Jatrophihabitans sp.]|nr:phosphotransferase [Jatrophihabitans sp.]
MTGDRHLVLFHDDRPLPPSVIRSLGRVCGALTVLAPTAELGPHLAADQVVRWTGDVESVPELLAGRPAPAAVGALVERCVLPAARVAAALNLPGPDPHAVAGTSIDKAEMRRRLSEHAVTGPRWIRLDRLTPEALRAAVGELGEAVLKPAGGENSVGVLALDRDSDPAAVAATAARFAAGSLGVRPDEPWLVEERLPGVLVSVDGFALPEEILVVGVVETELSPLPYFTHEANWLPPRLSRAEVDAATELAVRAVGALGLTDTPFHAELRLGPAGPAVVELAARVPGGQLPPAYARAYGIDLVEQAARLWCGLRPDTELRRRVQILQRGVWPRQPGRVISVSGYERAAKLPGVWDFVPIAAPGDRIRLAPELPTPLYFYGVESLDVGTVTAVAARVEDTVRIGLGPDDTVTAAPRLGWLRLPAAVRQAFEQRAGAPVSRAGLASGGFSPGFTGVVELADGRRLFVKAVGPELNADSVALLRQEAAAAEQLTGLPRVPRLLWSLTPGDWVVLAFAEVAGTPPPPRWTPAGIAEVLDTLGSLHSSGIGLGVLPTVGDRLGDELCGWRILAESGGERLDGWSRANLERLVELEDGWPAAAAGPGLLHADVRADNLLLTKDGVVLVDWAYACTGAAVFDVVMFLVAAARDGIDCPAAEPLLDEFVAGYDPDAVDSILAAFAGWYTERSLAPQVPSLPTLRAFQAGHAAAARRWLAHRLANRLAGGSANRLAGRRFPDRLATR